MTIPHHYSMKWDNYHSHVGDIFSQLLETGSMADVILYAEGERINCHKMLLSACSPYFQEILSTAGASSTIVVVSGIHGEDVRSIIEFVYRGEISVKADRFNSVLKAAEALKICGLMEVSSHLSEMEDSEIISNVEKNSKSFEEDQNHTVNNDSLLIKDNRKNDSILTSSTENTWGYIEMPVQHYDVLESDRNNCDAVNGGNRKKIIVTDCSVSDSVKQRLDVSEEFHKKDVNIDHSSEETLKLKTELANTDTSTKMECVANSEEESLCEEMKLKRKKEIRKKLYSEEAMTAALEDMKSGKNLVEAAAKHHVPRTTLYMRARAIGACPNMVRKGYPREKITAALESVAGGSSLQCAATEFGIPKTVLWRRVQKEIGSVGPQNKRIKSVVAAQVNPKEAILQEGVSITRVSPQYQIPKATLFRWEKVHLAGEMKLPKTFVKDKSNKGEVTHEVRLNSGDIPSTHSNNKPGLSQEHTQDKYKVKKSTLWSSVQSRSCGKTGQDAVFLKNENEDTIAVEQLKQQQQQQSSFHFSEGVHELPVSYVNNTQFSDSSIVILAPVENDKYSIQEQQSEEVPGSVDDDKVLQSIKVEIQDNHPDGSKNTST